MPKFVIQQHSRVDQPIHWDLMLEDGDVLKTFRMDSCPEWLGKVPLVLVMIEDHPLRFLEYQGPVNQGKGTVKIVESGSYSTLEKTQTSWTITFEGRFLKGRYSLTQSDNANWLLVAG